MYVGSCYNGNSDLFLALSCKNKCYSQKNKQKHIYIIGYVIKTEYINNILFAYNKG